MKKFWILFGLSLLLIGCGQTPGQGDSSPEPSAAPQTAVPTDVASPTVNPTEEPAEAEVAPTEIAAGCTLQTVLAEPDATEASLFPPVTENDNQIGPEDASTTIIEYGDFQ